jgi:hypothetical protein
VGCVDCHFFEHGVFKKMLPILGQTKSFKLWHLDEKQIIYASPKEGGPLVGKNPKETFCYLMSKHTAPYEYIVSICQMI